MKVIECVQGSPAWVAARLGRPTCSNLDKILTPATLKPSRSADGYANTLLAEWLLGHPLDDIGSGFMERGAALEANARAWFSFTHDLPVVEVGFCTTDDGAVGGSPDGLVGDDALLELKTPSAKVHVGYLLDNDALVAEYRSQVQGYLWLTGRSVAYLCSFSPVMASVVVQVPRDPAYMTALDRALPDFCAKLASARARLIALGCRPRKPLTGTTSGYPF